MVDCVAFDKKKDSVIYAWAKLQYRVVMDMDMVAEPIKTFIRSDTLGSKKNVLAPFELAGSVSISSKFFYS